MAEGAILGTILERLKELRERAGLSPEELDEKLILGPGWIRRFESGATVPSVDVLLVILSEMGAKPADLFEGLDFGEASPAKVDRVISAEEDGEDLVIHFRYADHDAKYRLADATLEQFESVVKVMRDGLARLVAAKADDESQIKADSVARMFLAAVETWPDANPSDLWWFLVYRAYVDPFNHPAQYARLNLDQSWKRTGGWALEIVLVRHYGPYLKTQGISLAIEPSEKKAKLLKQLKVSGRFEVDKVDVTLAGDDGGTEKCFGVVHVKASFAERRTDDVPMSQALVKAGYTSPLWTMDCKSGPSATPVNRGELGPALGAGKDGRSAKRKDIEDDGYFSSCFSYNTNTIPTPAAQKSTGRIYRCNFKNPDDEFSRFLVEEWNRFRSRKA